MDGFRQKVFGTFPKPHRTCLPWQTWTQWAWTWLTWMYVVCLFQRNDKAAYNIAKNSISERQALTGSRISIPGFFGTGFCQIPGSRDFSGRDFPIFLIPGFRKKIRDFSGFSFLLHLLVKQDNFHQYLSSPSSFITNYPPLSSPFIEIIIGNPPQSLPSNRCEKYRLVTMPITVLIC